MSPTLQAWALSYLKTERKRLDGFLALGNEIERAKMYDTWIAELEITPPAATPAAPGEECPKCGAPCTTKVLMRGGDHGWGTTDEERTVYRYAALSNPAPVAAPALEQQIVELYDLLEEAYIGLKWYRDAHPEDDSQMDDELYTRIDAALAR